MISYFPTQFLNPHFLFEWKIRNNPPDNRITKVAFLGNFGVFEKNVVQITQFPVSESFANTLISWEPLIVQLLEKNRVPFR